MKQRLFLYASIVALTLGGAVAHAGGGSSDNSSNDSSAGVAGGSVGAASNTAAGGTSPDSGGVAGGAVGAASNTAAGGTSPSDAGVAGGAVTAASPDDNEGQDSDAQTLDRYRGMENEDNTEIMTGMGQSDLEGQSIVTADGEDIGEIEEVVVDESGQAHRVLVDVGGFLGIGERRVAIDPSDLRMSTGDDEIMIDMTRAQIESLPTYEQDNEGWWSGMSQ